MGAARPTYAMYAGEYGGSMGEGEFARALPRALARLRAVTGRREPPERLEREWQLAWCALADEEGRTTIRTPVASESVGSTSVTYAVGSWQATDYAAVAPWLSGTGLLYQGIGGGPHAL